MKKGAIIVALAGVITVAGINYSFMQDSSARGDATSSENITAKIINVDELGSNPNAYRGNIILHGVVAGIKKSQNVFGVIDVKEFKSCGKLSCARYILPIKYEHTSPPLKSFVNIHGKILKGKNGMIIIAQSVEVIK